MSKSGKFVMGLILAVLVIALFAVKPVPAADLPASLDPVVRILGVLSGTWIASSWMYPFLVGRR